MTHDPDLPPVVFEKWFCYVPAMSSAVRDQLFLLRELTLRDLRLRYIGSVMGLFWSVVHPLFTLLLYTLVFSQVIRPDWPEAQSIGSFASYLFVGLLPWIQFHESVTRCATVYLENSNLIKKVKFPVALLPSSLVLSSLFNQVVALAIFLVVFLATSRAQTTGLAWLLPALLIQSALTLGLGLVVASANVFVRDTHQLLSVVLPFLFWATPIVYPPWAVPASLRWLAYLNPLTHLVALYRAGLLGEDPPNGVSMVYLCLIAAACLAGGLMLLRRTRPDLSDFL